MLLILIPVFTALLTILIILLIDRKSLSHSSKPEKITSGPFKGKLLWEKYDQEDVEHEVFTNPIENVIASINAKTRLDLFVLNGSTLAQATIDRLELELDPYCDCTQYTTKAHKVSGHKAYEEDQKLKNDLALLEYSRSIQLKVLMNKYNWDRTDIWQVE